jgi:alkylation response protein AidB-like acyl-CoA dehydrogenase
MFEHLEILLPALLRFARPDVLASVGPDFLSGRSAWSQGFSEPEAGSDLANLRTAARPVDGGFVLDGRKIWTSWAVDANRCLVLARTGPSDGRHRNLTMFMVDLDASGVTVRPIRQATGANELAEVAFEGVLVDQDRILGELDGGWAVALNVLLHERGTFTWFRHSVLLARLRRLLAAGLIDRVPERQLGELLADFVSVRAAAIDAIRDVVLNVGSLPRASACKLQLTAIEQQLYDLFVSAFGTDLLLGVMPADLASVTQQEYQFSRAVSIYGGSREMQLNAIATQVLGL